MGDAGSKMRQFWLIACCVSTVLMQLFWVLGGHWGFFWAFNCIIASVLLWEVWNVYFGYKKTLSTEVTIKIREGGKKRIYMYLATLFMSLAIGFLHLHLVWQ